jgi:jumonji domain-containing protein 7
LRGERGEATANSSRNADSPTENSDGEMLFVKPWEEQQTFERFIDFVVEQERNNTSRQELKYEVRYAQTREFSAVGK